MYNFPEHMSSGACELVRKVLSLNPQERPNADEVYLILYIIL